MPLLQRAPLMVQDVGVSGFNLRESDPWLRLHLTTRSELVPCPLNQEARLNGGALIQ